MLEQVIIKIKQDSGLHSFVNIVVADRRILQDMEVF